MKYLNKFYISSKARQLTKKTWMWVYSNRLFVIFASVYLFLVLGTCIIRLSDLALAHDYRGDYNIYTTLSRIVSEGYSPLISDVIYSENAGITPITYFYYIGSIILSVIQIKILGVFIPSEYTARTVTFAIYPMICSIFLVYSIHFFGKKLNLTSIQRAIMLLVLVFINDWALIAMITHPKGEILGIAMGLIGCGYYFDKKYSRSAILFILSTFLHVFCIMIPLVLFMYNILSSIQKHKFKLDTFMPMISASLVFCICFSVLLVPLTVKVGPSSTENTETTVYVPTYVEVKNITQIDVVTSSSNETIKFRYFIPDKYIDIIKIPFYPLTHLYWSNPPRNTLSLVCQLIGYNLTQTQLNDMYSFKITQENIVPTIIIFFYGIGFTIIFLWILISVKQTNLRILCLCAYILPLLQTLTTILFGVSFYPERTIIYTALFFSMALAHSKKIPKFIYIIAPIVIFRAIIWTAAMTTFRGGY